MKYRIVILPVLVILIFSFNLNSQFIQKENSGKKIMTIILDAGHGGKDPGTTGTSGVFEKNIVLSIVLKVKELINKDYNDVKVVLTRNKDEFIELKDRGKIANSNNGDLFVSIHCNFKKKDDNDKKGYEIYLSDLTRLKDARDFTLKENQNFNPDITDSTSTKYFEYKDFFVPILQNAFLRQSERFAKILNVEMSKSTILESRGYFQDAFFVLIGASMPSILIECGFLSNRSDEIYLKTDRGQLEIAKAIYKSIRYYKLDYEFENSYKFLQDIK